VLRMDQDGEKKDASESRYDKKTNDGNNATEWTSCEGPKWHDWSVNALRTSVEDPTPHPEVMRSSTEWTVPGVAGNSMAVPDAYWRKKQIGVIMEEPYSQDWQISSQNHVDVKEKVVKNSPGFEHSMNGTAYLPLSYDPWDNDACIAISNATSTLLVNSTASQSLSNHQNPNLLPGLARNIFPSAPWSGAHNMQQENSSFAWVPTTAPFKYPTLEPKTNIDTVSSFSICGRMKSNSVPTGDGPPHMPMLNAPKMSNGVDSVTTHSARLAHENLPPLPRTDGTVSSTLSSLLEARFSNTDAATELALLADTKVRTSCSRETDTEPELSAINSVGHMSVVPKVWLPQTNQNMVVARFSEPNAIAVAQPISCPETNVGSSWQSRGSDTKSESSAVCEVDPTPKVSKLGKSHPNQNPIMKNGMAAGRKTGVGDKLSFSRALIGFAKPKLKPFWLTGHLTPAGYREILDKFLNNVCQSLGTAAPQTNENICNFIKEQNDSLSTQLKVCIIIFSPCEQYFSNLFLQILYYCCYYYF
jgi:hypothetical protein